MFDRLFLLYDEDAGGDAELRISDERWGTNDLALARGEWPPPTPLQCTLRQKGFERDYVLAGSATVRLISPRFADALRQANATGWRTYPVNFIGSRKPSTPYVGLAVVGRAGPFDSSLSKRVRRVVPAGTGTSEFELGTFFDIDSWDKSDLFCPGATAMIVVTEKAASRLSSLTGVSLRKLTETETAVIGSFMPHAN